MTEECRSRTHLKPSGENEGKDPRERLENIVKSYNAFSSHQNNKGNPGSNM